MDDLLKKVIKGLECHSKHGSCGDNCPYETPGSCSEFLCADALTLLKAQEPGWISVKDMLPEYNGQYIAYMPASGAVISAYYYKDNGGFFIGRSIVTNKVSHWSYLPEPPKEET